MKVMLLSRILTAALLVAVPVILPASVEGHVSTADNTVLGTRSGSVTLQPVGLPGALFHQVGLSLLPGDLVNVNFTVLSPSGVDVEFSLHVHQGAATIEILNLTAESYSHSYRVDLEGVHMTQWLNLRDEEILLSYYMEGLREPTPGEVVLHTLVDLLPFFAPAAVLGGLSIYAWWRGRRATGGGAEERSSEGGDGGEDWRKGGGPKGFGR
jgi:hypothetical protein